MAQESTPTAPPDSIDVRAQQEYIKARRQVALINGKIDTVKTRLQENVLRLTEGRDHDASTDNDDVITINEPVDNKALLDHAMKHFDQDKKNTHGDPNVVLFSTQTRLRGFFKGGADVHQNVEGALQLEESTWIHEDDHRSNGFIDGLGLDEAIAEDVVDELPEKVAADVSPDDELLQFTQRKGHEESATAKAGESTDDYDHQFVRPTDEVISRMDKAGQGGRQVVDRLIEGHDVEQFRLAARHTLEYEAGMEPSLN